MQNPRRPRARRPRTQSPARPAARLALHALCALAVALAALAASAAGACAVIVHLDNGKALSYQPLRGAAAPLRVRPFDLFFSNLDYNGGPIMPSNTNYTIYWHPPGALAYPAGYELGVNTYLKDLAHDSGGSANVDSVSAQYNDAAGEFAAYNSHFEAAFVDEHPYPANGCTRTAICLTDAQLQAELVRFVGEHKLPTDLTHEYFLLTPPKVESCFEAAGNECSAGAPEGFAVYCAYHGNIPLPEGHELIYSNDPYVTGNSGCDDGNHPNGPSDGALEGGLSHEHNESITDPEPNNAWTNLVGGETEAGEIGDKCGNTPGAPLGTVAGKAYNQEINGHFYWYQEEWSNQGHACLQRLAFKGEVPKAAFSPSAGAGNELKLNAATSTAPGGVARYSWQFNDGLEGLSNPGETTSATFSHTFPCAATYTVALTVYASDGTSNGTAHSISVNPGAQVKPSASFPVPGGAIAGSPVAFDGSASSGCPAITGYSWEFGDGSPPQGGPAPAHAYAAPGVYEVTLGVIDDTGLIGTVTHTIPVAGGGGGELGGGGGSGGGAIPAPLPPGPASLATPAPGTAVPPPAPTAAVALAAATARVRPTGRTALELTCAGTARSCTGHVVLSAKVFGKHHRAHTVTLAAASFTIPAGRTSAVTLQLSGRERALLRADHGRMSAKLTLSKLSPAPTQALSRTVRLVLARR